MPDLRAHSPLSLRLSISPSPVAIIHQIRNGVEKTARRIVDPLNTRGGGMHRRARQLGRHGMAMAKYKYHVQYMVFWFGDADVYQQCSGGSAI